MEFGKRFLEAFSGRLLTGGLALGRGLLELALSILIAFFIFRMAAGWGRVSARRWSGLPGDRGRHLLDVAAGTVRGVVYGILGTALVQAIMAGIGFLIAGVPGAGVLALLTFFLSVVPVRAAVGLVARCALALSPGLERLEASSCWDLQRGHQQRG